MPTDSHAPPAVSVRIAAWFGTVCLAGITGGFVEPGPENTSYVLGHVLNEDGSFASLTSLFLRTVISSPFVLLEGLIKCVGHVFEISGPLVFVLIIACAAIFLIHFILFVRIKDRWSWYLLWVGLIAICLLCIIGCTMVAFPNLLPGWT
jgi:hypothetical protein